MKNIFKLIISVAACLLVGISGSFFTAMSKGAWYDSLPKPSFFPPDWIFAPVWTVLFILMGISLYLVWKKGFEKRALLLFILQFALNVLWSALFFGLRSPILGLIDVILLFSAIFLTMNAFYKIDKTAGYLFLPYLCWTTYAIALNLVVVMLM